MLHRAEFAPGRLRILQRMANRAPVWRCGHGIDLCCGEKFSSRLLQCRHNFFACRQILGTCELELFQMRRHWNVGRFQCPVEGQPHILFRSAAEFVDLLPAFTQLVDGFGMGLDIDFAFLD